MPSTESPDLASSPDLAIVGAGVIGLSLAWRAAESGLSVRLLDPAVDAPAPTNASWAAAGMLAPVTEVHYGEQRLLRLTLAATSRWPTFAAELADASGLTGTDELGYRTVGTLSVARDTDDLAAVHDLASYQEKLGLKVERLTSREMRALEPALSPRVRGGLLVVGDHAIDNRAVVRALRQACRHAGVELVPERVEQVADVSAGAVVVATGADTPRLLPGLPVRPVKGQLLHLRGPATGSQAPFLGHSLRGLEAYLVPRPDGRVIVGGTVEEQGYDRRSTAGAVHDLLRCGRELVPEIDELEFGEAVTGLRPGTPDNAPLLGEVAPGVLVAAGHYRNGILLAPLTAELLVEQLVNGCPPELLSDFHPRRFE